MAPQEVTNVRVDGQYRFVTLTDGSELSCHTLLIASGVSYRRLDLPGIDKLMGAGVYYGAAITEASACRGENVFIVGAGNSAGQAAIHLSKYAHCVTLVVRGESLNKTMSKYLIDQIEETNNITVKLLTHVVKVWGEDKLEALTLVNLQDEIETLPASALFTFIGALPHTNWLQSILERDERGFILTGSDLIRDGKRPKGWTLMRNPFLVETSVPGIFAAGDVRHQSVKRVGSAVGEGAIAVQLIHQYLASL